MSYSTGITDIGVKSCDYKLVNENLQQETWDSWKLKAELRRVVCPISSVEKEDDCQILT